MLTPAEINRRFAVSIAKSRTLLVVLQDVLGEGEGAWDADPRYPTDTVYCTAWLQMVISEIYGETQEERYRVMDLLRYYGGHVAYGLRKHFLDHVIAVEPEPFHQIKMEQLSGLRRKTIKLEIERFKTFHKYSCPLYKEEIDTIDIEFMTAEGLVACVNTLPAGYYVCFPVASELYLSMYARNCGPMGFVHSAILEVKESPANPLRPQSEDADIHHASTVLGAVTTVPMPVYLEKMSRVFEGYGLFRLNPSWDFSRPMPEEEIMRKIRHCESGLPKNEDTRAL